MATSARFINLERLFVGRAATGKTMGQIATGQSRPVRRVGTQRPHALQVSTPRGGTAGSDPFGNRIDDGVHDASVALGKGSKKDTA